MINSKRLKILLLALLVLVVAGVTVYAASSYGSQSDPLITKSYLDKVLTPELMEQFDKQLADAGGAGATFEVVTLSKGQKLTCQVGCQVMLRIGSAYASGPDNPVLVDTTSGTTLANGGAMTKNHLYMVTIVNNGLTASETGTKVLVSGSYTIS